MALTIGVYVILPKALAWTGVFLASCIVELMRGADAFAQPEIQKYLGNLDGFVGEFTLLIGSGGLAVWIWHRRDGLCVFRQRARLREGAIGAIAGIIDYYFGKLFVVPWLYMARPSTSAWIGSEYQPVAAYGRSSIHQVASVFFIGSVYVSVVETVIFVGLIYLSMRSNWGYVASAFLGSAIFALVHQNGLFTLAFFLFGLVNLTLFEWRKSLAAPMTHHIVRNVMIYGSQLALFGGLPPK